MKEAKDFRIGFGKHVDILWQKEGKVFLYFLAELSHYLLRWEGEIIGMGYYMKCDECPYGETCNARDWRTHGEMFGCPWYRILKKNKEARSGDSSNGKDWWSK